MQVGPESLVDRPADLARQGGTVDEIAAGTMLNASQTLGGRRTRQCRWADWENVSCLK